MDVKQNLFRWFSTIFAVRCCIHEGVFCCRMGKQKNVVYKKLCHPMSQIFAQQLDHQLVTTLYLRSIFDAMSSNPRQKKENYNSFRAF